MTSFSGYLNCGERTCGCCSYFEVDYYSGWLRKTNSYRLYNEIGYTVASKIANNMPSHVMATAHRR